MHIHEVCQRAQGAFRAEFSKAPRFAPSTAAYVAITRTSPLFDSKMLRDGSTWHAEGGDLLLVELRAVDAPVVGRPRPERPGFASLLVFDGPETVGTVYTPSVDSLGLLIDPADVLAQLDALRARVRPTTDLGIELEEIAESVRYIDDPTTPEAQHALEDAGDNADHLADEVTEWEALESAKAAAQ